MAPLLRVVDARRVRARFSFLAAGSLSAALRVLAGACGLDFFERLARSGRYCYSVRRVLSLAVKRVQSRQMRNSGPASKMEAQNIPRALAAPPKVVFAPPTTSSEACVLASVLQAASYAGLTLSCASLVLSA